jgi:hypothetical protein
MEPESISSNTGRENASIERPSVPDAMTNPNISETILAIEKERSETAVSEPGAVKSDTSGLSGIFPTTVVTDDSSTDDNTSPVLVPMIASDDDLIEKEWVDRAKKIVSENRDDPYKQEEAVSELQKDYKKKRYGRETGGAL